MYVVTVLNSWLSGVARGQERIKDISLASIISSIGTILLNIIFLVWMKLGIVGYFVATILGTSMSIIYYVYVWDCREWIDLGSVQVTNSFINDTEFI